MIQENTAVPILDLREEYEEIIFYCNACGDVFSPDCNEAKYDERGSVIDPRIPADIRDMFNTHWTELSGSHCYIVQYDGKTGMLLNNEFDVEMVDGLRFQQVKSNAVQLSQTAEIRPFTILLGEHSGCGECHEIAVFLPYGTSREDILAVMYRLHQYVYTDQPIPAERIAQGNEYRQFIKDTYGEDEMHG